MYLHVTEFDERPLRGTHSLRSSARFWPVAILNDSFPQRETAAQFHEFNSASFGRARQRGKTTHSGQSPTAAMRRSEFGRALVSRGSIVSGGSRDYQTRRNSCLPGVHVAEAHSADPYDRSSIDSN